VADDKYWAAIEDASEFGKELRAVLEDHEKSPIARTVLEEQRNAYLQLFAINLTGQASSSRIMFDGQEGELATFRVPMASALANAVVNLITNQRIAWICSAAKADAASRAQTTLGNQALDAYWNDKGGETAAKERADQGVPFGECFTFVEFDAQAGEMVSPPVAEQPAQGEQAAEPEQAAQYEGDIRYHTVSSWDVKRDPSARSYRDCDWLALRLRRNRYDLAARYGAEVLEACEHTSRGILPRQDAEKTRTDLVDCWYFFHRRTPAVPLGREAVLIGDKAFADGPLRYRRIPVARFATGALHGTPFPFAPFWTALAAQELQDSLLSSIATNNLALGTQMVSAPMGTEVEPESVGPMRLLLHPPGSEPPRGINLTQSPPEAFKLLEKIQADQRQLLGLNGTILGQPEGANLSGTAMALLTSMAMQANSSAQADYIDSVEEQGMLTLEIFQDFFSVERKIRIAGKSVGYMAKEAMLQSDAVRDVNSVSVRVGNPLAHTTAGREAIVDKYIQIQKDSGGAIQLISTPEDLQQLYDTGRIEGLTNPLRDQAILVELENEALARGEPVAALLGDDDIYHCRHHRSVVTSLEARQNDALLLAALEHIHQHYTNFFGIDPTLDPMYRSNMMIIMGLQPPAPPPVPGGGGPSAGPAAPTEPEPGAPPGELPSLPDMPDNPVTGAQFDHETGGGMVVPPGA
jgi:hypothetical protein